MVIKNYLICYALSYGQGTNLVRQIIHERLGNCNSVATWLVSNGYIKYSRPDFRKQVQTYRHRWVDALIKEFSNA